MVVTMTETTIGTEVAAEVHWPIQARPTSAVAEAVDKARSKVNTIVTTQLHPC